LVTTHLLPDVEQAIDPPGQSRDVLFGVPKFREFWYDPKQRKQLQQRTLVWRERQQGHQPSIALCIRVMSNQAWLAGMWAIRTTALAQRQRHFVFGLPESAVTVLGLIEGTRRQESGKLNFRRRVKRKLHDAGLHRLVKLQERVHGTPAFMTVPRKPHDGVDEGVLVAIVWERVVRPFLEPTDNDPKCGFSVRLSPRLPVQLKD
jgi:hypothetical protein